MTAAVSEPRGFACTEAGAVYEYGLPHDCRSNTWGCDDWQCDKGLVGFLADVEEPDMMPAILWDFAAVDLSAPYLV